MKLCGCVRVVRVEASALVCVRRFRRLFSFQVRWWKKHTMTHKYLRHFTSFYVRMLETVDLRAFVFLVFRHRPSQALQPEHDGPPLSSLGHSQVTYYCYLLFIHKIRY